MPSMPPTFRANGVRPRAARERETDQRRGSAWSRGYDAEWRAARDQHLRDNPLCFYCFHGAWGDEPRYVAANLVDHFHPHRGDRALFWRRELWCSSCNDCHTGPKQALEHRGARALASLGRQLGLPPL